MKNSIKVQIIFSYRGETHTPVAEIELDAYLEKKQPLPEFYRLVAQQNNIDTYSYEYEVMQLAPHKFFDAQGLAQAYCLDDCFDHEGFQNEWQEDRIRAQLAQVARDHLALDDLDQHESIKQALLVAYELGKKG